MKISFRWQVKLLVSLIVALALFSGLSVLMTAHQMERTFGETVSRSFPLVMAANEIDDVLHTQRGLAAAYMMGGGNRELLVTLGRTKPRFDFWLREARRVAAGKENLRLLDDLEETYRVADRGRDSVVKLFHAGRTAEARQYLIENVASGSTRAHEICQELIRNNQVASQQLMIQHHARLEVLTRWATGALAGTVLAAVALVILLVVNVFRPMGRLVHEARLSGVGAPAGGGTGTGEVGELERYWQWIRSNAAETRQDLEESQRRLLHAERLAAIGKFSAFLAHEIRSPLTAMKLLVFGLRRSAGPAASHGPQLEELDSELDRLDQMATSFLEHAKPPEPDLERVAIADVVKGAVRTALHRLQSKGITLHEAGSVHTVYAQADPRQLRQVLLNLLFNAADATPSGGVIEVSSALERQPEGRAVAVLRVRDNGPGVPEGMRDGLFEPFVTGKPSGNGLGLAIAASIVRAHAGALVLEQTGAGGSCFAVRIPAETD